jgi:hypothetical protein
MESFRAEEHHQNLKPYVKDEDGSFIPTPAPEL